MPGMWPLAERIYPAGRSWSPAEDMVMLVCSVQALIQAMHRYTTSSSMGSTSAISIVELQSADDYWAVVSQTIRNELTWVQVEA